MADQPGEEAAQVEIVCPQCGYRMPRSADRLRRATEIRCPQCGAVVVPPDEPRAQAKT